MLVIHPTNNKIHETMAFLEERIVPALLALLDLRCTVVAVNGEMSPDVASAMCEPQDDCLKITL